MNATRLARCCRLFGLLVKYLDPAVYAARLREADFGTEKCVDTVRALTQVQEEFSREKSDADSKGMTLFLVAVGWGLLVGPILVFHFLSGWENWAQVVLYAGVLVPLVAYSGRYAGASEAYRRNGSRVGDVVQRIRSTGR